MQTPTADLHKMLVVKRDVMSKAQDAIRRIEEILRKRGEVLDAGDTVSLGGSKKSPLLIGSQKEKETKKKKNKQTKSFKITNIV